MSKTTDNTGGPSARSNTTQLPDPYKIREQAREKARSITPPDLDSMTNEEIQQLFYEMQVKQIGGDLQAEQLRSQLEERDDQASLFSIVTENMLDMVALTDMEGTFTFAGKSNEILGYEPGYLIGKNVMDFVHLEDLPRILEEFGEFVASGHLRRVEYRYRCKDGTYILLETIGNFIKDENGIPKKIVFSSRDITERKRMEERLRESEERHRLLVESSNDIVWAFDLSSMRYTYFSKSVETILGYSQEKVNNFKLDDIHPPETKKKVIAAFDKVLKGESNSDRVFIEAQHRDKNGHLVWMEINAVLYRDNLGQPVSFTGVSRDIRERKEAEETLRQSEAYYRAIFETSGTAMFIIEEDTTILLVNSNFEELSGYSKQEVEGKKFWTDFIQSDDLARMKENHYLRRQNPEAAPRHYEFGFINRRNEKLDILASVDMISGTNRSIASCIDITARKKAEEALRQSENYYRTIFETSGSAMFILEQDTTISLVNSNFEELSGYSRHELEWKKSWTEFVHSDDVDWIKKNHYSRRSDPRKVPLSYEFRFFVRSGEMRHGYLTVDMIPDTTQSVVSLIDITERKRADMALRQSEAKLKTIIEAAEGFISAHDRQLRIEFMNKPLIDKIGRDATGEFCYKALWGFDSPCPWCRSDSIFNGKAERLEYQNPGNGCWYYTIMSPIFDESGRVSNLEALTIDITERKREEIALAERAAYLDKENIRLKSSMKERFRFGDIIGKSPAMQAVYDMILKAAATCSNVVIYGETGTGKELVARAIHENSDRRDAPVVAVNCGAIPDTLIESEFFGYKKGAFTGAQRDKKGFLAMADGGTLFLDEIGEIGHGIQIKLLRVIEGYGYTPVGANTPVYPDIRLITATHRDLGELVKTGVMREDFFYRIDVIPIHVPPLRKRRDDLPLLIEHFRQAYSDQTGLAQLTGEILNAIQNYDWPGNVRELQNVLDRYFTLGLFYIPKSLTEFPQPQPTKSQVDLRHALGQYEKDLILSALEHSKWRRGRAADQLGITRRTLYKKMKIYGID
ncbi:MAG: PAS domain S-box protein [Desulfobacterales bacterium]